MSFGRKFEHLFPHSSKLRTRRYAQTETVTAKISHVHSGRAEPVFFIYFVYFILFIYLFILFLKSYEGRDMRSVHRNMKLTEDDYNLFLEVLLKSFKEIGATEECCLKIK